MSKRKAKRKAPTTKKTIARRGPPRRPLSTPTASVTRPLSPERVALERLRLDPALFADTFLPNNEKGKPWQLSRHLRLLPSHRQ